MGHGEVVQLLDVSDPFLVKGDNGSNFRSWIWMERNFISEKKTQKMKERSDRWGWSCRGEEHVKASRLDRIEVSEEHIDVVEQNKLC